MGMPLLDEILHGFYISYLTKIFEDQADPQYEFSTPLC